ncbi:MAG: phosphoenolpyruvate carboxykinase (GTP) [Spirochaetaceae bacterium]|nr:MAG: phosphoenolpyruvate carboxykinase (GTP) [Spirochaetaceae bacterium]
MDISSDMLNSENRKKLEALENPAILEITEKYLKILKPEKVTVISDDPEDIRYVRRLALQNREEEKLAMEGHTIHYDGYHDQARDKQNTRVLVTPGMTMSKVINTVPREQGLEEVLEIMDGAMAGKEALVRFFSLGPLDSRFTILAFQITDSAYVAHSEDILYRAGYEQFKQRKGSPDFFTFIHSAGAVDDRNNTKNVDQRRIYIDVVGNQVLTVNNQYAGNSLGLKKLALRLAVYKANHEDWLAEHMFLLAAKPEGKNRLTYFAGAFPSACGKTSTAMMPGQLILGDDIAYIRSGSDGRAYGVNIEQGIFGIIMDVNPVDDPVIYDALTTPRELIFSNVLIHEGRAYWLNMGQDLPSQGRNHYSDHWKLGVKDEAGNVVDHCHKNARYTIRISELANADPKLHDPEGVPIEGVIYGGRDSDTSVPVYQSLDWVHGVVIGATLESETTFATLGKGGVRAFSPMANLDFLVVPLGRYIRNHIDFGRRLSKTPLVFATNYFLKKDGNFLNEKVDKKVWLLWMEGRVHGEYDAIETPIGYIPKYQDLRSLFGQVFKRDYTTQEYEDQFSIRIDKFLEKIERMEKIYAEEQEVPGDFSGYLETLKNRLTEARKRYDSGVVAPASFAG